jgi:hypothetical protein
MLMSQNRLSPVRMSPVRMSPVRLSLVPAEYHVIAAPSLGGIGRNRHLCRGDQQGHNEPLCERKVAINCH